MYQSRYNELYDTLFLEMICMWNKIRAGGVTRKIQDLKQLLRYMNQSLVFITSRTSLFTFDISALSIYLKLFFTKPTDYKATSLTFFKYIVDALFRKTVTIARYIVCACI